MPEVVVDGVTGLVRDDPEELVAALDRVYRRNVDVHAAGGRA